MTTENKNTKLKIALDVAAITSLGFMAIVCPVWCHYDPKCINHGVPGEIPGAVILAIINLIPATLGLIWLIFRYANTLATKYPCTLDKRVQFLFPFCATLLLIFIMSLLKL